MKENNIKDLLKIAQERSSHYLETLDERSIAPSPEAIERLKELDKPLADEPTSPETILAWLDDIGSPATVATAGARYFGFVIGGSLPAALAANWLAGAWDQTASFAIISPIGAKLEEVVLGWLTDVLSLPTGVAGGFVTGATIANLTALAAARHALLKKLGWDVEAQGLFDAPPITVVVSQEVHASVLKALSILGLGRDRVIRVPVDEQGRIRTEALPELSKSSLICIQAGNLNTGSFDPAGEICEVARAAGAWVHVDGAFGLWAAATPAKAELTKGISKADSWATDAHKWLNVPYDSGLVFCRHPESLRAAMSISAAYLVAGEQREPCHYTPELSRRARGVDIWAAMLSLGRAGLSDLIERTCRHATRFAEGLAAAGYQILNEVVLNQVLVKFGDAETTRQVIAAIQEEGTCWCGGTVWQGQTAMRISVSSWATTEADVEQSLKAMLRIAAQYTQH